MKPCKFLSFRHQTLVADSVKNEGLGTDVDVKIQIQGIQFLQHFHTYKEQHSPQKKREYTLACRQPRK